MVTSNDGGPAFPRIETFPDWTEAGNVYGNTQSTGGGLSRRDWFAGQALQGILASGVYAVEGRMLTAMGELVVREALKFGETMVAALDGAKNFSK